MENRSMGIMQNKIAARYDFSIGSILQESWKRIHGFKQTFWGAIGWTLLTFIAVVAVLGMIGYLSGLAHISHPRTLRGFANLVTTLVSLPLIVGILMLGIRRSVDRPVQANQVFSYFRRFWIILGVYIVQNLILSVVCFLLLFFMMLPKFVVVGSPAHWFSYLFAMFLLFLFIYLAVGYLFAMVLCVEKDLGIIGSLKASRKAVSQHWFKVFFLLILGYVLIAIGTIPLLIGLIWVLPLVNVMYGTLYRTMFGVEEVR